MTFLDLFSCLVIVCLAVPAKLVPVKKLSTLQVGEILRYSSQIHNIERVKRSKLEDEKNVLNKLFNHIDTDLDGQVTGKEFAKHYFYAFPEFGMTTNEWIEAFKSAIEKVEDSKHKKESNGKLEIDGLLFREKNQVRESITGIIYLRGNGDEILKEFCHIIMC